MSPLYVGIANARHRRSRLSLKLWRWSNLSMEFWASRGVKRWHPLDTAAPECIEDWQKNISLAQ